LLSLDECIAAVEDAFRMQHAAKTTIAGLHASDGGFHIKAAILELDRPYFAAKVNANFPSNRVRGLPTIQGTIALCDAVNGYPLALMDSIEITMLRTGAASAVAAKYLARSNSRIVTICGCGTQGRIQLRAIARVRKPELVYLFDIDGARAEQMAAEMKPELAIEARAIGSIEEAVRASDLCVTCTPSRQTLVRREWVKPGTFIAAVGADSDDKQEIDPQLMASSKVVVDVLEQCASIGDLHHAITQGLMTAEDVHGELGAVVGKRIAGRENDGETIIFDSTGSALQDVAAAALVYRNALGAGIGVRMNFDT